MVNKDEYINKNGVGEAAEYQYNEINRSEFRRIKNTA